MSNLRRIENWHFFRVAPGESGLEPADLPSSESWRPVRVPHDWSIEDVPGTSSPFSETLSAGGPATGYAVGGEGWYQTLLPLESDRPHRLVFDGVYGTTDVWVDRVHLATHRYGYTAFAVEVPPGRDQAHVTVRVRNWGSNSRWYSGSGLYRPVVLEPLGAVSFAPFGVAVRTIELESDQAAVEVVAELDRDAVVEFLLIDPEGHAVGAPVLVESSSTLATARLTIPKPLLWHPMGSPRWRPGDQPLYRLVATTKASPEHVVAVRFGLRTVEFDARRGLRVNGARIWLKGACVHHDHGIIGAAAYEDAEERKVRLLRDAGFNAIRTSHNPPSSAFLDVCDRMGFLVIDEVHDEWETAKTPDGYHRFFPEFGIADAGAMVRRDRNHPSVWCWSIGNEIPDSFDRPDLALRLRQAVLEADPSRPISAALCRPWWPTERWVDWQTSSDSGFAHLDIGGMNYLWETVRSDHERHPDRVVVQTETYASAAYDSWQSVVECPWNLGDFVWTGQDYIGESGIGQSFAPEGFPTEGRFPFHLAVCGDLDLIGLRKPRSHYRECLWREGLVYAVVHVPAHLASPKLETGWHRLWGWDEVEAHWNWGVEAGFPLEVEVYTSCEEIEWSLNGRPLGSHRMTKQDRNRFRFKVPYEPGTLLVRGNGPDDGFAMHGLRTAGPPSRIAGVPQPSEVPLRFGALGYVMLSVVDGAGVPVPHCQVPVEIEIDGPGELVGFGNADPTDVDSVTDSRHRTFDGHALAAVRPIRSGTVRVVARSPGLTDGVAEIRFG
ncbi:MAG: glycoside hydrolase family 2 TIM barrel-domain containing protein [Fimbriimonadaceae bacterium]